jgi:hypothetical protein
MKFFILIKSFRKFSKLQEKNAQKYGQSLTKAWAKRFKKRWPLRKNL